MLMRLFKIFFGLFLFLTCFAIILLLISLHCIEYYFPNVTFNQIVFHILYLDGHSLSFWWQQVAGVFLLTLTITLLISRWRILLLFLPMLLYPLLKDPLKVSDIEVDKSVSLPKQMLLSLQKSKIYEKYYQTPQTHNPKNKKNIILIFAESVEDNFADQKYWGENLIPNLSKLKNEGISFEGYQSINGTNWTLASNVSAFCGVPLRMQLRDRLGTKTNRFLPNITCLPDVLKSLGYYNVFVKGAYISFVGTDKFVSEHSFDEIYGRDEMIIENYAHADDISMEEYGINDQKMFEFARKKITDLAQKHSPFFISIQTLDTHFPHGYVNPSCKIKYNDTRDAVMCSDKIIAHFVRWVQQQNFYNNTMVIIVGDHLMMSASDIADLSEAYPNRQIYNVILEKDIPKKTIIKPYSMMDVCATIADWSKIIVGGKFGLGVSLLGNAQTLTEKLGAQKFEEELLKNSAMYNHFLGINQPAEKQPVNQNVDLPQEKMIAHAAGGIDGHVYTNSLEALELSAARGYKYIEIDLLPLIDKKHGFFAAHDYEKFKEITGISEILKNIDRQSIKKLKILGKYTPLTDDLILDFFTKHPDIFLVTDKVSDYALLNEKLGVLKNRMIVKFWTKEQYKKAKKYGFKYLVYGLNSAKGIPEVLDHKYKNITVSAEFFERHKHTLQTLRLKKGIKVMIYTAKTKEDVAKYNDFADFIYYDGEENLTK